MLTNSSIWLVLVLTLPAELGLVEEKNLAGDLDRNSPVVASVFLMLLQCKEDIFRPA